MNTPSKNAAAPRKQASAVAQTQGGPGPETQTFTLPFRAGEVIAEKYEVVGALGVGGVAYVISALHLELHEMVALKFLRPESLAHDDVVARFASEARAVARIKNEHVAHVFDVGWLAENGPYIVMEYLEGKDLADILAEGGPLAIPVAVDYVLQACEALACAHATGIVHRDIKPENLFLAQQAASAQVVKVLDFGISKSAVAASDAGRRAHTMLPMGTPGYMSPEQIRSCANVDARTDIWALGCVLNELLTDRATFEAPTVMQLSANILERNAVPLRKALPGAPAALEAVILKCLEKRPEARFQDVAELAAALYPFGPRRARLSVERCHQILRGQPGVVIEFNSVPPPSGEPKTPPPVSSTAAVVSALPTSAALGPLHTGVPTVLSAGAPEAPPPKRSRAVMLGGLCLLGLGGLAFALRAGGGGAAPAGVAAGQAQAATQALTPVTEPRASPAPSAAATTAAAAAAPAAAGRAVDGAPSASAKPSRSKARPARAGARPARPAATAPSSSPAPARRVVLDDSEPDVGY